MFKPRSVILAAAGAMLAAAPVLAEGAAPVLAEGAAPVLAEGAGPGLGRPATAEEIAAQDISVDPSGATLPPGSGSVAEGLAIFTRQCVACHGEAGAGGELPIVRLTGAVGSLATEKPVKTVSSFWPYATTLFDYNRRAMPLDAPQSLSDSEVYAVTAYILSVDGIVAQDAVLDAKTLLEVKMPNRDGFVDAYPMP